MLFPFQNLVHFCDLPPLALDDLPAQPEDLRVLKFCFPAHQDRPRVVRDHGPQKTLVTDPGLIPGKTALPRRTSPYSTRSGRIGPWRFYTSRSSRPARSPPTRPSCSRPCTPCSGHGRSRPPPVMIISKYIATNPTPVIIPSRSHIECCILPSSKSQTAPETRAPNPFSTPAFDPRTAAHRRRRSFARRGHRVPQ